MAKSTRKTSKLVSEKTNVETVKESATIKHKTLTNAEKLEACKPIQQFLEMRMADLEKIAKDMAKSSGFDIQISVFIAPTDFSEKETGV